MTHDPAALFAELARELCGLLLAGADLSLEERVFSVYRGLGLVTATAGSLPVLPGRSPAPGRPTLEDWPGFGSFEDYWKDTPDGPLPMRLSQTLDVIHAQLRSGLDAWEEGDTERAVGCWSHGFETVWGPASHEVLAQLQPAVAGYRRDRLAAVRPKRRGGASLVMVGGASERPAPAEDDRATLGLRLEAVPGGLLVLAVHPRGPAAGQLVPGDALLSVDEASLDGLSTERAGPTLAGSVGSDRRLEVFRDGQTLTVVLRSVPLSALEAPR